MPEPEGEGIPDVFRSRRCCEIVRVFPSVSIREPKTVFARGWTRMDADNPDTTPSRRWVRGVHLRRARRRFPQYAITHSEPPRSAQSQPCPVRRTKSLSSGARSSMWIPPARKMTRVP